MTTGAQIDRRFRQQVNMVGTVDLMTAATTIFHGSMTVGSLERAAIMAVEAGFLRRSSQQPFVIGGMGIVAIDAVALVDRRVQMGSIGTKDIGRMASQAQLSAVLFQS
jgi:hypothetical protein